LLRHSATYNSLHELSLFSLSPLNHLVLHTSQGFISVLVPRTSFPLTTMTTEPNHIQNEDVLFHFDDSEDHTRWFDVDSSPKSPSQVGGRATRFTRHRCRSAPGDTRPDAPNISSFRLSSPTFTFYPRRTTIHSVFGGETTDGMLKAKNPLASQPMLIRRTASPSQHDLFALSLEPAFSLSSRSNSQSHSDSDPNNALPMLSLSPSSFASASSSDALLQTPADRTGAYTHSPPRIASQTPDERFTRDLKGKGKERSRGDDDSPPVLPPLGFSPPVSISSPSSDFGQTSVSPVHPKTLIPLHLSQGTGSIALMLMTRSRRTTELRLT
jgi:hypothetical protein